MILGVCGSPRKATTHYVLAQALGYLEKRGYETVIYSVHGKNVNFCTHCNECHNGNGCIINDDVQSLYPLLREAEALVLATPVYYGGVSAQLKTLMDRTRALFAADLHALRGKLGAAIAVGGDRAGGQELALQQIHTFYIINGLIPVGGGVFGANLGAALWSKDSMDGIKADKEGLKSLNKTMKNLSDQLEVNRNI